MISLTISTPGQEFAQLSADVTWKMVAADNVDDRTDSSYMLGQRGLVVVIENWNAHGFGSGPDYARVSVNIAVSAFVSNFETEIRH